MACSIIITSVTGIPVAPNSTTTSTIHITGTQTGACLPATSGMVEIIVEVICGNNTKKGIATPDALGNWSVDVPLECRCNGDIVVRASCATDPTCVGTHSGNLQCEGNCPTGWIEMSVGDCNPDGTRNVTLTAHVTTAPPGTLVGQFAYGDGTFGPAFSFSGTGSYPDPNAPHHYAPPGPPNPVQFLWALPSNCPPLTAVLSGLQPCPVVCPNVTVHITASQPSDCDQMSQRSVTFDALVSGGTPQYYHWNFGDNSSGMGPPPFVHLYSANIASTPTATVEVTLFNGACLYMDSVAVNIPACGGPPPPPPPPPNGGEGDFCLGLRWSAVILAILATLSLYICVCVPNASVAFCWVALGFAIGSAVLLAIWLLWCPKPCGAALLIGWQIALGAGIGALYFAPCCPILWVIGAGLIAAAIAGLITWARRCKRTFCQVLVELAVVITVVVIPILAWIAGIPILAACINHIVATSVALVSAAVALGLAKCAHH